MSEPANDYRSAQQDQAETLLGNLLRTGVFLSFACTIFGLILVFVHHPAYLSDASTRQELLSSTATFPTTPGQVLEGLRRLEGRAVVALGVLLLILTPIFRVIASAILFALQKDRTYALLTLGVLMILVIAFLLGKT